MPKFKVGDHVACISESQIRNHYVIAAVLAPGEALKNSYSYPGCSILDHVNETDEVQYICPDDWCGVTFAFKESEIKAI